MIQTLVRNVINNEFKNEFPAAAAAAAAGGSGGADPADQTLDDLKFRLKSLRKIEQGIGGTRNKEVILDGKENAKTIAQQLIDKNNKENKNLKSDFSNFEKKLSVVEEENNKNRENSEINSLKFKYKPLDERLTEELERIIKLIPKKNSRGRKPRQIRMA